MEGSANLLSAETLQERAAVEKEFTAYFARCRSRIAKLSQAEFSWLGTWNSKRRGLVLDLAITSFNVVLAVPAVFVRRAVTFFDRNGYKTAAGYFKKIPTGIQTRYQKEIEKRIWTELFGFNELPHSRDERERAINQVLEKEFSKNLHHLELGLKLAPIMEIEIEEFFAKRAYISDLMSAAVTWGSAWFLFRDSSLGIMDLGGKVAHQHAKKEAASHFFLGESLGRSYYNMVPVKTAKSDVYGASLAILVSITALAILASYFSEPVQLALGIQTRQLNQLIDTIENNVLLAVMRVYSDGPQT